MSLEEKILKIEFDPSREIVITEQCLIDILQGVAALGGKIYQMKEKLSEDEFRDLVIHVLTIFTVTSSLYPKKTQKQIFDALGEATGVDFTEIFGQ